MLFGSMQLFSVVNESDEIMEGQIVSKDSAGITNEGDHLAQQYFVGTNDEELPEATNDLV